MATLKEHQAAMVDLLANGSGIPASASRLAHAVHDLINVLYVAFPNLPQTKDEDWVNGRETRLTVTPDVTLDIKDFIRAIESTTPGLNDKAISKPQKALKTDSPAKWPTPAEQRVKELENTIRQLKANLVHERACVAELRVFLESAKKTETKLRQEIYNVEQHRDAFRADLKRTDAHVADLISRLPEHAGCRKEDAQVCDHDWRIVQFPFSNETYNKCDKCGAVEQ